MDPQTTAPPVVVVVVAQDPGQWFEEVLAALDRQDYPNLSVLVVDAGSRSDPSLRVAAALPSAYVRRVDGDHGFAGAANDVLETVQGAAFLLFCHDDVAPDPDAVRRMVEEAIRSNAGVVGAKVVEWDRPQHLLDVGLAVDKTGASASLTERGELDQEQHDAVRDVFAVADTFLLVRSDLFEAMGGFDLEMAGFGADIDLCWRAQVAGARVVVAPAARVRHREAGAMEADHQGPPPLLAHRNHLRAMFKNYSLAHVLRVTPQAAVLLIGEVLFALGRRRPREARGLLGAWIWNLRSLPGLRSARRAVADSRAVPDGEVRRLQARGSVRLTTYLQRNLRAEDRAQALVSAGQELVGTVGRGPAQMAAVLLAILALTWLVGTRNLLGGRLPAVGEFAPIPGPTTLLAHWMSGWRTTGMGIEGAAPSAFGWLGLSGIVLLGKTVLLQKLLVLGAWPLAAVGVWRLTRPFSSGLARVVGVIAYASVPISYNALARGRWGVLVAYAALPWLLGGVVRATGLAPWSGEGDGPTADHRADAGRDWRLAVLGTGLGLAAAVTLSPALAITLLLTAAGLVLGSLLAGGLVGALRGAGVVATATLVAAVLLLPWSLELLIPSAGWATLAGVAPAEGGTTFAELLRFQVGPLGAAPLGWALLVAAAYPLLMGRGWRFAWAARLWGVALVSWLAAWAAERGWSPLHLESPDDLLVPAALAMALAAALGAAAFDADLRGYRFGWRQVASVTAAAAVAAGVLPVMAGAGGGRFNLPAEEVARSLSWMGTATPVGAFRVLWIGEAEALPLDGWPLGGGLAFATSRDGTPTLVDRLPGRPSDATDAIATAVRDAQRGDTVQLGHLLAPMAVRFVVVPLNLDTGRDSPPDYPVPASLTRALASQIDLRERPADASVTIYENTAWGPGRALLDQPLPATSADRGPGSGADLSGGTAVLFSQRANRYRGTVAEAGQVLVSEGPSDRWRLTVGGDPAARSPALGVANSFRVDEPGRAVLRFRTPFLYSLLIAAQVGAWVVVAVALVRMRGRRRGAGAG